MLLSYVFKENVSNPLPQIHMSGRVDNLTGVYERGRVVSGGTMERKSIGYWCTFCSV
jgi:hypothetical protein